MPKRELVSTFLLQDQNNLITIYDTDTVDEALKLLSKDEITHAIVDIDLGDIKNGFDFLEIAQREFPNLCCMVHSNRHFDEYRVRAKQLGAKMFVPKPLNIEHLVLFLSGKGSIESTINFSMSQEEQKKVTPKVILYSDDMKISRMYFENQFCNLKDKGYEIHTFPNGEELLSKLKEIGSCEMIFTDQYMESDMLGTELLREVSKLNIPCRKFIVSNMLGDDFINEAKSAGAEAVLYPTMINEKLIENIVT